MHPRNGLGLAAAMLLAACGGSGNAPGRDASEAPRDTAIASTADSVAGSAGHDAHVTVEDSSVAAPGLEGMNHSAHAPTSASGTAATGTDHAGHGASTPSRQVPGGEHAGHAGAPASRAAHAGHRPTNSGGCVSTGAHAGHTTPTRGASGTGPAGHTAAGGQNHAAAHPSAAAGHAGHAPSAGPANAHAGHAASPAPAAGDRKLLDLAAELVRDPVVQREIEQDPALRDAWSDPGVRSVVTQP